jgi:hypothetical protein
MPWRRASDRFDRYVRMVAGFGILGFAVVLKFRQPAISDTLLLGILATGSATMVHPSWFDRWHGRGVATPEDK